MHITLGCKVALLSGALLSVAVIAGGAPAFAGRYKMLYSFKGGASGSGPTAGLIKVGGKLYGTARDAAGTFFSFNPRGNTEKVLYHFAGGEPMATMANLDGTLYGITVEGGAYGWGDVYAVQPATGAERIVYSFRGGTDGYFPEASLLNVGGTLYGTTVGGGTNRQGAVFAVNPATGKKHEVYSFMGGTGDGDDPQSSLIDVSGTLYGTTNTGGPGEHGTVYAVDPKNGKERLSISSPAAAMVANPTPA